MSGPAKSKIELKNVKVYIHKKDPLTRSRIMHLDVEGDLLGKIKPDEITFVKGKPGGVFIALKRLMIERAKVLIEQIESKKKR